MVDYEVSIWHTLVMKNTAAVTLAHRVNTLTSNNNTFQAHCDGCNWTGDQRNSTEGAYWEGLMHEFDGNQGVTPEAVTTCDREGHDVWAGMSGSWCIRCNEGL